MGLCSDDGLAQPERGPTGDRRTDPGGLRPELWHSRVRHRRVQARSVRGHSQAHDANEIRETVIADSGVAIGRDVAGIDRTDWRRERYAPGEGLPACGRVAGGAVAEHCDIFAVLHIRLALREQRGNSRIGDMEDQDKDGSGRDNKRDGSERPRAPRVHSRTIGPGSLR